MNTKLKKILGILGVVLLSIFVVVSIVQKQNIFFSTAIILWGIIFLYGFYKEEYFFLGFLASFFAFLLGGELLINVFGLKNTYVFTEKVNQQAYILVNIALLGLFIGYFILDFLKGNFTNKEEKKPIKFTGKYLKLVRIISLSVFFVSFVLATINLAEKVYHIMNEGFLITYLGYNSVLPGFMGAMEYIMDSSYVLFLATMPKKNTFVKVTIFYLFYSTFTLMTFHRIYFAVNFLMIFLYILFREKFSKAEINTSKSSKKAIWLNTKTVLVMIISFVVIIPLMNKVNDIRFLPNKKLVEEIEVKEQEVLKLDTKSKELKKTEADLKNKLVKIDKPEEKKKIEQKITVIEEELKEVEHKLVDYKKTIKETEKIIEEEEEKIKEKEEEKSDVAIVELGRNQGFSINAVKWSIVNREELPNKNYVFGNVIDYFEYGSFAQKFLGKTNDWYREGNSIEMATQSRKYSHALTYKLFPEFYLKGRGIGSSYIAEAYHVYGSVGVFAISMLAGVIMYIFYRRPNLFTFFAGLLIYRIILIMPRGPFDTFILEFISLKNIALYVLVFGGAWVLTKLKGAMVDKVFEKLKI